MLTYEKAKELLTEVVEEAGYDYVYKAEERRVSEGLNPVCYYVENGEPSCGIGRVIAKYLGHVPETGELGEKGAIEGLTAVPALRKLGIEYEEAAGNLLRTFQEHQDSGEPWGKALRLAVERVEGVPA